MGWPPCSENTPGVAERFCNRVTQRAPAPAHHSPMVRPGRLKLNASEIDRRSRVLLEQLARLRRLDMRHLELSVDQKSLLRDRNQEVRRRDAARSVLAARRQVGWARDDIPTPAMDAADAIEIIRQAEITIRVLNKIWAQNQRHLLHVNSIRRVLKFLVKR